MKYAISRKRANKILTKAIRAGVIDFIEAERIIATAFICGGDSTPHVGKYRKEVIIRLIMEGVDL